MNTLMQPVIGAGTLARNQLFPNVGAGGNWSNTFDLYENPDTTKRLVFVLFHGTGGTKETFAQGLGLWSSPTDSVPTVQNVNWTRITNLRARAIIVVQGNYCIANAGQGTQNPNNVTAIAASGPLGTNEPVTAWGGSGLMYSGSNDSGDPPNHPESGPSGMVGDIPSYITSRYVGDPQGKFRIMVGHSQGGMFGSAQWLAQNVAPTTGVGWHAICGSSNPTSNWYGSLGTPVKPQPRVWVFGGADTILNNNGTTFQAPLLTGSTLSVADLLYIPGGGLWPNPQYIGPIARFNQEAQWYAAANSLSQPTITLASGATTRISDGTAAVYDSAGSITKFTNVDGGLVMYYIAGCSHATRDMQKALKPSPTLPATLMGLYSAFVLGILGG